MSDTTTSNVTLFTQDAYLKPLEDSGCVSPARGWTPQHLGRTPCYVKTNSWGEFVFDFQIARAYAQHGLDYYPKLTCCVPFTPVPGSRLLADAAAGKRALAQELADRTLQQRFSSAHILFLPEDESALLSPDWLTRAQPRYVWRNRGYTSFEDFLAQLPGKQRKNIRRERRAIADSGLQIRWQTGNSLSAAEWQRVHAFYASTYQMRGQEPYLNLACLQAWAENFGERMLFCVAADASGPVAMAFYFRDGVSLYGRHWGAGAHYAQLHFELCYYQGIEYCVAHGLSHFDAGVQGEHKLNRGFDRELSHSAHWYADPRFRSAIADFYAAERRALKQM